MNRLPKAAATGSGSQLQALAAYLRHLKDESGLRYSDLADRTGASGSPGRRGATTLSQAASGTRMPLLVTVEAFARAAAPPGSPGEPAAQRRAARARALWESARAERARRSPSGPGQRLQQVRTTAALGRALAYLRRRAGLSLAHLDRATAAGGHRVPRSSIHLILEGKALPTRDQLAALLTALRVKGDDAGRWHTVRDGIDNRLHPPAAVRSWGYTCADSDPRVQDYLERRERDEEIKRRTGQIHPDETYDDYQERMRNPDYDYEQWMFDQVNQRANNDWHQWNASGE
ncbi:helix-turn-helix domain-containing protein [Kitasatospora sp. NPDC057015]|uniref:helix-turn-helix domain-containing protein n=1 Tax=Kitasatospora sp. NPDC057015 TaxID=3346001 RepID=UPI00363F4675